MCEPEPTGSPDADDHVSRFFTGALIALAATTAGCAELPTDQPAASPKIPVSTTTGPLPTRLADRGERAWQTAATSVQGRPIRVQTLGYGPRRVLFIGGIHGDEPEGSYTTTELPTAFNSAGLAERVTLTIIEDANPDGRAAGTRSNANDVDINRNFPATNFDPTDPANGGTPLSQPESRAITTVIEQTDPQLVIVMHSWENRQFINYDGPARDIAERFAANSGLPLTASGEFAPTPGSLGSYAGRDQNRPVLTIELRKGSNPIAAWEQIRDALVAAIGG